MVCPPISSCHRVISGTYSPSLRILTDFANTPDPDVVPKLERRRFAAEYKLLILSQMSMCCIMLAIMRIETSHRPLTLARIARVWWPLAASWLLMGAELPALSAVIARLPNPDDQSGSLWRRGLPAGVDHRVAHYHAAGCVHRPVQGLGILPQALPFHDDCGCGSDSAARADSLHPPLLCGGAGDPWRSRR